MKKLFGFIVGLLSLLVIVACGPQQVTVTFNANGGTAIETLTIEQGSVINTPVTTRTGYTFEGWFEDQNFTGSTFDFSKPLVRNYTLYAKWTINSYTINFIPDNGQSISAITKNFNEDIVLPTVTKEGHVFGGWYTNQTFTGEPFSATKMPANNMNLYAKWTPVEITITFYINDEVFATRKVNYGSDLTDIPTPPSVIGKVRYWDVEDFTNITEQMEVNLIEENAVYTVTIVDGDEIIETLQVVHGESFVPTVTPSKVGYNFIGYNPGLNHIITSDLTVEVIYERITFTVIFRNHQGNVIAQSIVNYGENATAPAYSAPSGYEFTGWSTAFTNVTSNLVIDAQIKPIKYQIVLSGNGGVFTNSQPTLTIETDYQAQVGIPSQPTRDGYNFVGWYRNDNDTQYQFSAASTMPLNGLELYAQWSPKTYTITYHNLFATVHGNPTGYDLLDADITLSNPSTRTGYTFAGWFDALVDGNQVTLIDTSVLSNQVIYARWTPITYTLTFSNLQGTIQSNQGTYTIETPTINLVNPTERVGYTFDGWFTQLTGGTKVEVITLGSTGNRTLFARWTPVTYTITYNNLNGATNGNPASYTIETSTITLLAPGTRTGYTFVGWFDASVDGNEIESIDLGSMGQVVLYARWTPITYTVTYNNLNGASNTNPSTYTIESDQITLVNPGLRTGYTFDGWFLNSGLTTPATGITAGSTGNRTFYAKWTANSYTNKF